MPTHQEKAKEVQRRLIREMTPARRLEIAAELYDTAWAIKEAALRKQYPHWTEAAIQARVRRIFVTGYAGD